MKWIKPTEKLPDTKRTVLIFMRFYNQFENKETLGPGNIFLGDFDPKFGWDIYNWDLDVSVDCWMDFPDPQDVLNEKTNP